MNPAVAVAVKPRPTARAAALLLSFGNVDSRGDPIHSLFTVCDLHRGTALCAESKANVVPRYTLIKRYGLWKGEDTRGWGLTGAASGVYER